MSCPNLADPAYEPTDEELAELMRGAFEGITEARERQLIEMRRRIAVAAQASRRAVLARLAGTREAE